MLKWHYPTVTGRLPNAPRCQKCFFKGPTIPIARSFSFGRNGGSSSILGSLPARPSAEVPGAPENRRTPRGECRWISNTNIVNFIESPISLTEIVYTFRIQQKMVNELPTDHADLPKKNKEDSISRDDGVNQYDINGEEKGVAGEMNQLPDLQRRLKSRHLSMIAIGKIHVIAAQKPTLTLTQVVR